MSHVHIIFSLHCNWLFKTVQLQTKTINAAIMMSRTNQIAGITGDFKMDIIKDGICKVYFQEFVT